MKMGCFGGKGGCAAIFALRSAAFLCRYFKSSLSYFLMMMASPIFQNKIYATDTRNDSEYFNILLSLRL